MLCISVNIKHNPITKCRDKDSLKQPKISKKNKKVEPKTGTTLLFFYIIRLFVLTKNA